MSSILRGAVSKKKRRYQKNGFDLDLSYITDHLIAMGFPSENVEGVYRNPFKEVFRFLEQMHKDRYKVYNLCSERGYDISKFHNRVECFPFDDHNAPPLELVLKFCKNVKEWLDQHKENVAVIHCKAGKGRTGVMVTAYMIFTGEWKNPQDALDFYAAMRTYNKKGVTIPSQIRYVKYFGRVMNELKGVLPEPRTLLLNSIELSPAPLKISNYQDIRFSVYVNKTLIFTHKSPPTLKNQKKGKKDKKVSKSESEEDPDESLVFECVPVPILGDIKIDFFVNETFGSERMLAFWFQTAFVDHTTNVLELKKEELDKAHKDKSHKSYKENFRVILSFTPLEADIKIPVTPSDTKTNNNLEGVLNGVKAWNSSTKRDAWEVSGDLLQQLVEMVAETDESLSLTRESQIISIRDSNAFKAFVISTCELQQVVVNELSQDEKLCFWINAYNLLALHANVVYNASTHTTLEDKVTMMKQAKYNIAGITYSLFDIEFAMLRHKMTIPDSFGFKNLDSSDQRRLAAIPKPEPRLNFTLNFGNADGAPIRIYRLSTIFEQLETASRVYLHDKVRIDNDKKEIRLPRALEMYHKDFDKSPRRMLKTLTTYLNDEQKKAVTEKYKTVFEEGNWKLFYSFKHFDARPKLHPELKSSSSVIVDGKQEE